MTATDTGTKVRAILEEELGAFKAFADMPSRELEAMAARLTRALAPVIDAAARAADRRSAA